MFTADEEGFWVSRNMNISADLWKLQQLESSASQAELVQSIQLLKRGLPLQSMKTQRKFKQHYQCVEHDSLQGKMFCQVCKSNHMFCVFCCFFCACLFVTIGLHKQEMSLYSRWLIVSSPFDLILLFFNFASKLRRTILFPLLLTSQVFSSRAPVRLESIVSNLSSHITIPVAITTVQKDGTWKTKIVNDGQSDVS